MPITGSGWELHVKRTGEQPRPGKHNRTVSTYQVFHDGAPVAGLIGFFAERQGPGDNTTVGKAQHRCIAAGTYKLSTHAGAAVPSIGVTKYKTHGYSTVVGPSRYPRPSIRLRNTGVRAGILFHPGSGWQWSTGCLNPSVDLSTPAKNINLNDSWARVIALIDDLKAYLGGSFPAGDNAPIPRATIVID